MDKQARALNNLAVMRDRTIVFHSVRALLDNTMTDAQKLDHIRNLYVVFDDEHPLPG